MKILSFIINILACMALVFLAIGFWPLTVVGILWLLWGLHKRNIKEEGWKDGL